MTRTDPRRLVFGFLQISVLFFSTASFATAEFILEFGRNGVVGSDGSVLNTSGTPGDSITIELYLTQTNGETALSSDSTGLAFAAATVDVTLGGSQLVPQSFVIGNGFTDSGSNITSQVVELSVVESSGLSGVDTSLDGVLDNSVMIGAINYSIGQSATGKFTLTASEMGNELGDFFLAPLLGISVLSNTAIIAIPEPTAPICFATIVLLSVMLRTLRIWSVSSLQICSTPGS